MKSKKFFEDADKFQHFCFILMAYALYRPEYNFYAIKKLYYANDKI